MDVPVGDQDSGQAVLALNVTGSDGDVVEDAEPHRAIAQGVMARRPDRAEGVGDIACHHGIDGGHDSFGGQHRRLVRLPADWHIARIQIPAAGFTDCLRSLDIFRAVNGFDPLSRCG
jgi:hypothetical protein